MGGRGRGRSKANKAADRSSQEPGNSPTTIAVEVSPPTQMAACDPSTTSKAAGATAATTNALLSTLTTTPRTLVPSKHSTPANSRGNSPTNGGSEASSYTSSVLTNAREKAKQDAERRYTTFVKFEEAKEAAARNDLVAEEAKEWLVITESIRREVELAHMVAAHKKAEGDLFLSRHVAAAVDHLEVTERESRDELEDEELEALAVVVGQLFLSRQNSQNSGAFAEGHPEEALSAPPTVADAGLHGTAEPEDCASISVVTTAAAADEPPASDSPSTVAHNPQVSKREVNAKKKRSEEEAEHAFESLRNDNKPIESACPCCSVM